MTENILIGQKNPKVFKKLKFVKINLKIKIYFII
jgi:hypothetical protein